MQKVYNHFHYTQQFAQWIFKRLRNELTYVHNLTQLPVNYDVFAVFKTMFFELW
jgi:hypothetical protein